MNDVCYMAPSVHRRPHVWQSLPPVLLAAATAGCGPDAEDVVAVGVAPDAAMIPSEGGASACLAGGPICRADFATTAFARAVCSCGDLVARGVLSTDVLGGSAAQAKASVGVDGALSQAQFVRIGGDLTVAGTTPILIADGVQTAGDLRLAAGGDVAGVLAVAGDAWLGATLTTAGVTTIGGDLHLAPGATLASLIPANVGGQTVSAPFTTDPP